VLAKSECYEIMRPEDVGWPRSELVIGKHSGRHAIGERATALVYTLSGDQLARVADEVKALADKKKNIYDEDLRVIIEGVSAEGVGLYRLISFHTSNGTATIPTATVVLQRDDEEPVQDAATGDGPVDAIYKTINRITGMEEGLRLLDYQIRAVTGGKDAMGEVSILVEHGDARVSGRAASTDILEASAQAYIAALNRIAAMVNGRATTGQEPGRDEHP
jgi:2-isopropylmalate synthase